MKILLTGATGYVGSELLAILTLAGHEVWCLTRSEAPILGVDPSRRLMHDLCRPLSLRTDDFDLVIHAAGANDVDSRDPAKALTLTALTARNSAEFAARQKSPRLLYASTFQVYGRDGGAIDETAPCFPRSDYAATHRFAEEWIVQLAHETTLQHVLLRIANIAGVPRSGIMRRWTLVPGCFCLDAFRERRIIVRSDGTQQRDFLSLGEVASRTADIAEDFASYAGHIVNLCSGIPLTIAEVARTAAERYEANFGRRCALEFRPPSGIGTVEPKTPLTVESAYFLRHPERRLSLAEAQAMMVACIDDTYRHLQRTA